MDEPGLNDYLSNEISFDELDFIIDNIGVEADAGIGTFLLLWLDENRRKLDGISRGDFYKLFGQASIEYLYFAVVEERRKNHSA